MGEPGYIRGHEVFFDKAKEYWRYIDTRAKADLNRPCAACGKPPTSEGYDACLGYIPGALSACCGHGIGRPYVTTLLPQGEEP